MPSCLAALQRCPSQVGIDSLRQADLGICNTTFDLTQWNAHVIGNIGLGLMLSLCFAQGLTDNMSLYVGACCFYNKGQVLEVSAALIHK